MSTCINCKNFSRIYGVIDGICNKGQGYTEATVQGLPKPKDGTGYVLWFNNSCRFFKENNYES